MCGEDDMILCDICGTEVNETEIEGCNECGRDLCPKCKEQHGM